MKPQTKKVTKAQQILAQVKKKKKLEEQKKVKKKEKEETKKVKKKEVAEIDNEKIDNVDEVKLEKPAVPKKDSTPSKPKPRKFVLPSVSSRSSRKITPVRFFDEQFPSGGSLGNRSKVRLTCGTIRYLPLVRLVREEFTEGVGKLFSSQPSFSEVGLLGKAYPTPEVNFSRTN